MEQKRKTKNKIKGIKSIMSNSNKQDLTTKNQPINKLSSRSSKTENIRVTKINPSIYKLSWNNSLFKNKIVKKTFKEKFINLLMINGEKAKAYNIVYKTGFLLQRKLLLTKKTEEKVDNILERTIKQNNINSVNFVDQSLKKKTESKEKTTNYKIQYSFKYRVTKPFLTSLDSVKAKQLALDFILYNSIENVKPSIEVKRVRIAGTTYQVPAVISRKRQETLAIRWIIEAARKRKQNSNKTFSECLAQELWEAYNKQGQARQKRDELHKMAESNRAYIRYRWW